MASDQGLQYLLTRFSINNSKKRQNGPDIPTQMANGLVQRIKVEESTSIQWIGRTHGVPYRGYGYFPLRFGENVVRRMGTQQHSIQWVVTDLIFISLSKVENSFFSYSWPPWRRAAIKMADWLLLQMRRFTLSKTSNP